jgi:DsbC/DsbD-like thiol-disulfide interchange protein
LTGIGRLPILCSVTLSRVRSAVVVSALAASAAPALATPASEAVTTSSPPARHVEATLLAASDAVVPGRPLAVAIRLRMAPGWHTYWRNPGDSGLPTRARWTLPEGFSAGELQWPVPERFPTGPIVSYGYAGEVVLPVEIRVPAALAGPEACLAVRVDWLECQEACIPGRSELTLTLPVRASASPGPDATLLAEARRRLPAAPGSWGIAASAEPAALVLVLRPPAGEDVKDAYFYPLAPRVLDHAQPQALEKEAARRYRLRLVRDPNGVPVERLAGVLVVWTARGPRALAVDAPVPVSPKARTSRN